MRAWTTTCLGSPRQALSFQPTRPVPSLPPTNPRLVLIRVTHSALNPADLVLLHTAPPWLPFRRSPVPGQDFVGEVVALPANPLPAELRGLRVGDRVGGATGLWDVALGRGSLAEYMVIDAGSVAVVPEGIESRQAVGLMGIAGQTAVEMIRRAGFVPGDGKVARVLVNGASGGVGTVLVQALKGMGKEVVAVCSAANAEMVRELGADEVIDYKVHDPLERHLAAEFGEKQFDAILDCVGNQALYAHSPGYLKPDGKFISIVGGWSQGIIPYARNKLLPVFLGGVPRSFHMFLLSASGETAKKAAQWFKQGLIKQVPIDSEFPLEQGIEAFEKLATKRAKGKIIINVAGTS
ncbi:NAD(P)-binding protein [Canariomyces notabilis]|uniref:NAD(P)-binding protein n=1 Tax=Canariomyces notabilis TaxID=2074819 RepID=A0AAN6TKY9_9PEZI|nr:NAD(P)-binding protein [Canariomyces arenarius]